MDLADGPSYRREQHTMQVYKPLVLSETLVLSEK